MKSLERWVGAVGNPDGENRWKIWVTSEVFLSVILKNDLATIGLERPGSNCLLGDFVNIEDLVQLYLILMRANRK